jgi:hypothetical protein
MSQGSKIGKLQDASSHDMTAAAHGGHQHIFDNPRRIDALKPAPPDERNDVLQNTGPMWWVGLNNDQIQQLEVVVSMVGGDLAPLSGPMWLVIAAANCRTDGNQ